MFYQIIAIDCIRAAEVAAAGLVSLIDDGLKIAINRPRPTLDLVTVYVAKTGKSFSFKLR